MSQNNAIEQDAAYQQASEIVAERIGDLLSRLDKLPQEVKSECPELSQSGFEAIQKEVTITRNKIIAKLICTRLIQ